MKTPTEARQQLVKALRSGRYVQGKYALKQQRDHGGPITHCCLGVACEEFIADGGELETYSNNFGETFFVGEDQFLPESVREWLGFKTHDGQCTNDTSLSILNDNGESFDKIAAVIESGKVLLA